VCTIQRLVKFQAKGACRKCEKACQRSHCKTVVCCFMNILFFSILGSFLAVHLKKRHHNADVHHCRRWSHQIFPTANSVESVLALLQLGKRISGACVCVFPRRALKSASKLIVSS
jgi:hypothetical protein